MDGIFHQPHILQYSTTTTVMIMHVNSCCIFQVFFCYFKARYFSMFWFLEFPGSAVLHVDIKCLTLMSLNQHAWSFILSFPAVWVTHSRLCKCVLPRRWQGKFLCAILTSITLNKPQFISSVARFTDPNHLSATRPSPVPW